MCIRDRVEAVTGPLHAAHFNRPAPRRLAGVIALFDRLERRDRGWGLTDGRTALAEGGGE